MFMRRKAHLLICSMGILQETMGLVWLTFLQLFKTVLLALKELTPSIYAFHTCVLFVAKI